MDPKINHLAGMAAEAQVAALYERAGNRVAARRWRGPSGEIDLILRDGATGLIFVEVKKSRSHAEAAQRVSARQRARIGRAACEFVAREDGGRFDRTMRFDVALVDALGCIEIRKDAFRPGD
ncbi:YraN family protein [Phaeovulum vinaykumarii]|uniref:UPF0102 protein SAMN05421795_102488 n=1 Tax=Phaeovulum vinaykumarii TaxID=407234 RepID=A0A1N7L2W3_9RHOB|nr:YraN family protein [Phaeovulum vinaykumarii]SIS68199.1 putative endonuclease [Phaeovulum vinaykumarii]SOC00236.1 putative endonuclease [Phaeovulum vinaykumarii]